MKTSLIIYLLGLSVLGSTIYHGIGINGIKSEIELIENEFQSLIEGNNTNEEFTQREILLAEVLKREIERGNIDISNYEIKGNTLVLYSSSFGDLFDAHRFASVIEDNFEVVEIKNVKKKN